MGTDTLAIYVWKLRVSPSIRQGPNKRQQQLFEQGSLTKNC